MTPQNNKNTQPQSQTQKKPLHKGFTLTLDRFTDVLHLYDLLEIDFNLNKKIINDTYDNSLREIFIKDLSVDIRIKEKLEELIFNELL